VTTPDAPRDPAEQGPIASVVRLFLGQLAAVIAIAAAITVVVTLLDPDDDSGLRTAGSGGGAVASDSPTGTPPTGDGSPAPSDSTAPTSPPATSTTAPATPVPSTTRVAKPPKVDVLNQSAAGGSAATVAAQLEAIGWRIGRVDDFSGNVSTTTVYWLDRSDRKEARRLAKDLGGVRVQPGFSTLVDNRLSVILVD
jgi:hypothetical protein